MKRFLYIMIVCFKPRALRAVTNATMEARSCFCLSACGGNPSHPLCGWSLISLLVLVELAMLGCAASISYQRVSTADLPGGVFMATVYRSSSGATAVILDNPNDDIVVKPGMDRFRFKEQGMQTAAHYLADTGWRPDVFGLKSKESGETACYLLLSSELRWLFSYDNGRRQITITIEDLNELPKGGS